MLHLHLVWKEPTSSHDQIEIRLLTYVAVLFERLNLNNTAILVVDHQVGLINMVGDWDKTLFRNNILGHAGLAKLFNIPVVMTSSFQQGILDLCEIES